MSGFEKNSELEKILHFELAKIENGFQTI